MKITFGTIKRPVKLVVYGPEGIGKSTIASKTPNPLFIDTEGGTAHLAVRRIERPASWDELIADVREVAITPGICGTLVIDTADWAEQLCVDAVCKSQNKSSIEDFGYGKGYTILSERFQTLLHTLNSVVDAGINVVLTAHAKMRKFELPEEAGSFDRWEMKLSKQVAPLVKEWCDALIFMNYKTYIVADSDGKKKAQGGKRVMYTNHHPCWDAKNRHGLPGEVEATYAAISSLFQDEGDKLDALIQRLKEAGIPVNLVGDDGVIYAADKDGHGHMFRTGTNEIVLKHPVDPDKAIVRKVSEDAFIKAMLMPGLVDKYFK